MGARGRFKFKMASQRTQEIAIVPFDDIIRFATFASDYGKAKCFPIFCINALKCRQVPKFKTDLKRVINGVPASVNTQTSEADDATVTKWRDSTLESLLKCIAEADAHEMKFLLRLLAALYRDFGTCKDFPLPLDALLKTLEENFYGFAEPIYSFLATCFRLHSDFLLSKLTSLLPCFMPWLRHKHVVLRNKSLDVLSLLLRRCPSEELEPILWQLLTFKNGEVALFGLVRNAQGTFTSKLPSIFVQCCQLIYNTKGDVTSCTDAEDGKRPAAAKCMRAWILVMCKHAKAPVELAWLLKFLGDILERIKASLSDEAFVNAILALEPALEMYIAFARDDKFANVDFQLLAKEACRHPKALHVIVLDLIIPLCTLATSGKVTRVHNKVILKQSSNLVLELLKCDTLQEGNDSSLLDNVFDSLLRVSTLEAFIGPLLTLCEWRILNSNFQGVANACLWLLRIQRAQLLEMATYHSILVNTKLVDAIVDTLVAVSAAGSTNKTAVTRLGIQFACSSALVAINGARRNLRIPASTIKSSVTDGILGYCLELLNCKHTSARLAKLAARTFLVVSKLCNKASKEKLNGFINVLERNYGLLNDAECLETLRDNYGYNDRIGAMMVPRIFDLVPCANVGMTIQVLEIAKLRMKGHNLTKALDELVKLQTLPLGLETERKKSVCMSRAVEIAVATVTSGSVSGVASVNSDTSKLGILLLVRILASQFYVNYRPLWTSAIESILALAKKLANSYTLINDIYKVMWRLCESRGDSQLKLEDSDLSNDHCIDAALDELCRQCLFERNVNVDADNVYLQALQVVKQLLQSNKGLQREHVPTLAAHVASLFDAKEKKKLVAAIEVVVDLLKHLQHDKNVLGPLVEKCAQIGLVDDENKIKSSCLKVLAWRFEDLGLDTLEPLANGKLPETDGSNDLTREKSNLYKAVEARLLVPTILQRQSAATIHNKAVFDYMATMEPCWIGLALLEMFPMDLFYEQLPQQIKDFIFKCAADLPIDLKLGHDHEFKPSLATALHTCSILVQRLQQALEPVASLLMHTCCILLEKLDLETQLSIHKRLFALLVQLPQQIPAGTRQMLDVIMKHLDIILPKFASYEMIVTFVKPWVSHEEFCFGCRGLIDKVFVHSSSLEIVDVLLEQIRCNKDAGNASDVKKDLLVHSADIILDTVERLHANDGGVATSKVLGLLQGLCGIGIGEAPTLRTFEMLLVYAPSRIQLRKRQKSTRAHMEKIKGLRVLLDVLLQCLESFSVGIDSQKLHKLEKFAILVLEFVVDATSRCLAASISYKCAATSAIDCKLMELLIKANTVPAKGIDARVSVDVNMEVYMEVMQVLEPVHAEDNPSHRCLHIWSIHVLFLIFTNQKDVGLVTCSTSVLGAILDVLCRILSTSVKEADGYCTSILNDAILGMSRRILLSKSVREPMTKFAFQLLKLYSNCFSSLALHLRPLGLFTELQNETFGAICTRACAPQRHLRVDAILQLAEETKSGRLGHVTVNQVVVPIAIHMINLGTGDKDTSICRAAIQSLSTAATRLDEKALYKLLKRLVSLQGVYTPAAIVAILRLDSIALTYKDDTDTALKLDAFLKQLKGRLLTSKNEKGEELASPPVFEAVGALLRHFPKEIAIRHAVQMARICSKSLCSRDRKVRRLARVALVKLVQQLSMPVLLPMLELLSKSLTKGFQVPVRCFTSCAMLSAILQLHQDWVIDVDVAKLLLDMIEQEFIYMQQRADTPLQTDEARHPRARQLCILMAQHGNAQVVTLLFSRLAHSLWGESGTVAQLQRNDKFSRNIETLLDSVATGFCSNQGLLKSGEAAAIVCKVALGSIWYIRDARGILTKLIQSNNNQHDENDNAVDVEALERKHVDAFYAKGISDDANDVATANEALHKSRLRENLNRRMQLLPGTSIGRALDFDPLGKSKGLDRPFVASMMISCCLSIYYKMLIRCKDPVDIGETLASMDLYIMVTGFLVEDVAVQRASVGCLVQLAGTSEFVRDASDLVADALVARIYTLQNHAPELSRGYLRLANSLLATRHSKLLLDRIDIFGCLNQRILQNLQRPELQIQLLKLADVLECRDEALYSLVLDTMLKGAMVPGAFTLAPKCLSRYILSLEESNTQRWNRMALLIKHLNSEIPRVRIAVLSTLSRVMIHVSQKHANAKAWWSQFMTLLATALARLVVADDDDGCKGKMVAVVSQMWRDATRETRLEMIASIIHFSKQQPSALLPYYILCCAKSGVGMEAKLLDALVPCVDFTTGCKVTMYYWLRILECLLQMSSIREGIIAGDVHGFISMIWGHAKNPKEVLHPWIFAASARCVALVLASKKMVERLLGDFSDFGYSLLYPSFQMLSLDTVQRHPRVAQACRDVCNGTLSIGFGSTSTSNPTKTAAAETAGNFKTIVKIVSKLCWLVRIALRRRHENAKRLVILVEILTHACKQPAATERIKFRATLLRIIIALYKVANARTRVISRGKRRWPPTTAQATAGIVNPSHEAQSTLQWLERKFAKMAKSVEHLELLSFARNYVAASRLASRRQIVHRAVLDPAKAANRKIKRHKRRRV